MIKCNYGDTIIRGTKRLIKAELSTLIYCLKDENILSEKDIMYCVKEALTFEETDTDDKESVKSVNESVNEVIDLIKKLSEDMMED